MTPDAWTDALAILQQARVPGAAEAIVQHSESGWLDGLEERTPHAIAEWVGAWACGVAGDGEAADRLEEVLREPLP